METIKLNDILKLDNLENVKIRFIISYKGTIDPLNFYKNNDTEELLKWQYWNYKSSKEFKLGQTTVGFVRIKANEDYWLLFHIGKITKDLNIFDGVGYEYKTLSDYEKYSGRLIIKYKNKSTNLVRNAVSVIDNCEVDKILPSIFDNDIFPGYDKVNISWEELSRVLDKDTWKTALQNQKGVYLITDTSNGKMYVGSAYGENMLLGRWQSYVKNGNGGNVELEKFDFDYIKANFKYSILEIFKSTIDDKIIIKREHWWMEVLQSRKHGYNRN
jgi:hypothetical protein